MEVKNMAATISPAGIKMAISKLGSPSKLVASIETSAQRLELIVSRVSSLESRVTALEISAARTDAKYHSSGSK